MNLHCLFSGVFSSSFSHADTPAVILCSLSLTSRKENRCRRSVRAGRGAQRNGAGRGAGRGRGAAPGRLPPAAYFPAAAAGNRGSGQFRSAPSRPPLVSAGAVSSGRGRRCHGGVAGRGAMRGAALRCSSLGTVSRSGCFAAPRGDGTLPRPAAAAGCVAQLFAGQLRGASGPGLPSPPLAAAGLLIAARLPTARFLPPLSGGFACPQGCPVQRRGAAGRRPGSRFLLPRGEVDDRGGEGRWCRAAGDGEPSRAEPPAPLPAGRLRGHRAAALRGRSSETRRRRRCLLPPSLPAGGWVRRRGYPRVSEKALGVRGVAEDSPQRGVRGSGPGGPL